MKFILKGSLTGAFTNGCVLPVSNKIIKLYCIEKTECTGFHLPVRSAIELRQPSLLGEGILDGAGSFEILLKNYSGGKIEVHWYCTASPVDTDFRSLASTDFQFYIRKIQPNWVSDGAGGQVAEWNYTIPAKWFLDTLKLFDLGYICGRVKDYKSHKPVAGVSVTAYGWEPRSTKTIGQALTDTQGRFVLFYPTEVLESMAWDCAPWPMEMDYYLKLSHQEARVQLNPVHMGRPLTGFWNNPHMFDPQR